MQIDIIEGHNFVQQRTFKDKSGNDMTVYWQNGYAHLGGAFPVEIEIPLDSPADAYSLGKYKLSASSYRVSPYRKLEVNPYSISLEPLK
jgi:hypothetical protein